MAATHLRYGLMRERDSSAEDADRRAARLIPLFLAYHRRLYGFTLRLVPNVTDADDLLQEVSRLLWQKFTQLRPGGGCR